MQGIMLWILISSGIIVAARALLRHIDKLDYEAGIIRKEHPSLSVRIYRRLRKKAGRD